MWRLKLGGERRKHKSEFQSSVFQALSWDTDACTFATGGWACVNQNQQDPHRTMKIFSSACLSLHNFDDPLCCRVQLDEVFHVCLSIETPLLWKSRLFHSTEKVIAHIYTENCKSALTDVASDLIKRQIVLFYYQRPERTNSEEVWNVRDKRVCVCVCVSVLVLAEKTCQHIRSLQVLSQLNSHGHILELWRMDAYKPLWALLVEKQT